MNEFETMKRPYITEFERKLISYDSIDGDIIMLRFRLRQFEKAVINSPIGIVFIKLINKIESTLK